MPLLSLYINNKAGGLIYQKARRPPHMRHCPCCPQRCDLTSSWQNLAPHAVDLDTNEQLRLASTFNGLALILKEVQRFVVANRRSPLCLSHASCRCCSSRRSKVLRR